MHGLDMCDLGDAIRETRQASTMPIMWDSAMQMGYPNG